MVGETGTEAGRGRASQLQFTRLTIEPDRALPALGGGRSPDRLNAQEGLAQIHIDPVEGSRRLALELVHRVKVGMIMTLRRLGTGMMRMRPARGVTMIVRSIMFVLMLVIVVVVVHLGVLVVMPMVVRLGPRFSLIGLLAGSIAVIMVFVVTVFAGVIMAVLMIVTMVQRIRRLDLQVCQHAVRRLRQPKEALVATQHIAETVQGLELGLVPRRMLEADQVVQRALELDQQGRSVDGHPQVGDAMLMGVLLRAGGHRGRKRRTGQQRANPKRTALASRG